MTHLTTAPSKLKTFLFGLCMGAADVVPGISGGTVAFILGIYPQLIESLCGVNGKALALFYKGEFRKLYEHLNLSFLIPLLLGIATSILTLAKVFHALLNHPLTREGLFSVFFGLVLGSTWICLAHVSKWNLKNLFILLLGAVVAWVLSGNVIFAVDSNIGEPIFRLYPWIILCGMIAISAMLLPGISGSYLLNLLGVYPFIIASLNHFTSGALQGIWQSESFFVLVSLFIGIVLGALTFARVVRYAFEHHRQETMAALIGFMIGAIRSVWPFWHTLEVNNQLLPLEPMLPQINTLSFVFNIALVIFCCMLVIFLDKIAKPAPQSSSQEPDIYQYQRQPSKSRSSTNDDML